MQVPFHPIVVHFPIVLSFLVPLLALVFALLIKRGRMMRSAWIIIIGLQLLTVGSGYLALETGENDEETVEKVVNKSYIQEHEKYAEIFVGITVVATVLGVVAFFLQTHLQFYSQLATVGVLLAAAFYSYETGHHGGELVYVHGAARAYSSETPAPQEEVNGILPTPGKNTSESPYPVNDENESLKVDDNDYGNEGDVSDEGELDKGED